MEKDGRFFQMILGAIGELINIAAPIKGLIPVYHVYHDWEHDFPGDTGGGTSLGGWSKNNNQLTIYFTPQTKLLLCMGYIIQFLEWQSELRHEKAKQFIYITQLANCGAVIWVQPDSEFKFLLIYFIAR